MSRDPKQPTAADAVQALYKKPIRIADLQAALLASQTETLGLTSSKDQKIQDLIFNYLQTNKSKLSRSQVSSFAATLAWICVGRELTKFLAMMPNASLNDILLSAKEKGFDVEVSS